MAATAGSMFSGMAEMPQRALRGEHRVGSAKIRGFDDFIEVDLGEGLYDSEARELSGDFHENLAEALYTGERKIVAHDLIEFFEIDKQSREDWEKRVDTALTMLGITKEPDNKLPFKGASAVVHPGIAKAVVQYQSRAIEEFFPPTGPVKCTTAGKATRELEEQAERVESFMNWYYTDGDKGYFSDTDQLHFKLPLVGSIFRKSYMDPTNGRPLQRHVGGQDFIAPYHGQDLESMSRYCHRYFMSGNDIRRAIDRGFFVDVELAPGSTAIRHTLNADSRSEDRADDRSPVFHQKDDVYEILEYHIDYKLPAGVDEEYGASFDLPYIIFVEKSTGEVLRISRNWRENDPDFAKRVWFTHYRYLPGLGFYGFGLLHVIGSLGEAATGAIRALLDSGARANLAGGFKSKSLKLAGDVEIPNGYWKDVDMDVEDLTKAFYTPPTPTPAPALFQLVELLTNGIDEFASTVEAVVGDAPTTGPVGTTLAMIEQGSKVFSAIHKRTHASARHEFALFCELVEFAPYEDYPYAVAGEDKVVFKADFDGRVDVIPVSDPNIWSSTQRIALAQAGLELVNSSPDIYGPDAKREAHRRMHRALKTPDLEALLPEKQAEPHLDPVSENMRMMIGKHVKAFPHQLHEAHIAVHENWLQIQVNTQPPEILDILLPQALAHIQEHKAYAYQQQVMQKMGVPLPIFDLGAGQEEGEQMPPELEAQISAATAQFLLPMPAEPQADSEMQAAMGEEDRKDMAAEREQARQDLKAALEERRKQMQFDSEQQRQMLATRNQERRLNTAFSFEQRREEDRTDADLSLKARQQRLMDKKPKKAASGK